MKEYKILKQSGHVFKNNDALFEKELNDYAHQGWRVINSIYDTNTRKLKVILEKEKN